MVLTADGQRATMVNLARLSSPEEKCDAVKGLANGVSECKIVDVPGFFGFFGVFT